MRYVPDIIPKEYRVLPDYFKGNLYASSTTNKSLSGLFNVGAIIFLLAAICNIKHPLLTVLFGIIGFTLLQQGHIWLERQFRFRLTLKIKSIFCAVLFVAAVPFIVQYQKIDKQDAIELKIKTEKEAAQKLLDDQKEQRRKDSINYYLQSATTLEKNLKIDEALSKVNLASRFFPTESEKSEIANAKNHILAIKAFTLVKDGKYQTAIPQLTYLLSVDSTYSDTLYHDLLYNRAVCYSKTGKIQEAVDDLKPLLILDNEQANKLHDKINPIRKKIVGYETLCCDGTTSSSRGQGACSRHGGVCDWNHPIYEESRKYN